MVYSYDKRAIQPLAAVQEYRNYVVSTTNDHHHFHHHRAAVPSTSSPVLRCRLPDHVAPVFVQVVSPPLGWSPLSYFLVISMFSEW